MTIHFTFKQQPEDFLVEEQLTTHPCGYGDFCYFWIEKRQHNTMDILQILTKHFPLQREDIGIA